MIFNTLVLLAGFTVTVAVIIGLVKYGSGRWPWEG